MLLKIGDGAIPAENFTTLGGLRTTLLKIQRQILVNSDLESGQWRDLLPEGGMASVKIQGNGVVINQLADGILCQQALDGTISHYECCFGNGDKLSGAFAVTLYERKGGMKEAEGFSIALESAGTVSLTAV